MKSTLIQYRGGGYDGCFWEWNFCLIQDKKLIDIYSSGRQAITTLEDLTYRLKQDKKGFYFYALWDCKRTKHNLESWASFTKEVNAGNVIDITRRLDHEQTNCKILAIGIDLLIECPICSNDSYPNEIDIHPYDYQGNGGIGIQYNSFICYKCLPTNIERLFNNDLT